MTDRAAAEPNFNPSWHRAHDTAMRDHIAAAREAVAAGVPLRTLLLGVIMAERHWSLPDMRAYPFTRDLAEDITSDLDEMLKVAPHPVPYTGTATYDPATVAGPD